MQAIMAIASTGQARESPFLDINYTVRKGFEVRTEGSQIKGVLFTTIKWMLVEKQVRVGLTRSAVSSMFPSLLPAQGASK